MSEATVEVDTDVGHSRLHLQLVPRIWALTQRRGDQIFLDRSVPEVLEEKLQAIGLVRDRDFVFSLVRRYPTREYIAQHDETDHAFFSRLCEHDGIATSFEHRDGREVLVISDTQSTFQPILRPRIMVRSQWDHPAAFNVRTTLRRTPATAITHDYNYRTPHVTLREDKASNLPGATGKSVEYGRNAKTTEQAAGLSAVRTEEMAVRHCVVEGYATEISMRAGGMFTLSGVAHDDELLLTKVTYEFRRGAKEGADDARWQNRFSAIPSQTRFRPARVTAIPRIPGLVNATVDGAIKGAYAELDESGRYHLRVAYDRSDRTDLTATHPVRMMQPHAGPNYGMHFPLRPGTEVLLAFVNGDPDRPIMVGAAPNPITASPVVQANQTQNVLRTGSDNEIVIEDQQGELRMRLHTPHKNTTVQLGAIEEPEEGVLTTTEANISEASRLTNNEATTKKTLLAETSTAVIGRVAVTAVGIEAVTHATEKGIESPANVSLDELSANLDDLAKAPEEVSKEAGDSPATSGSAQGGLWSEIGAAATDSAETAALRLMRAAARTTDDTLDRAKGRLQGEAASDPEEPAALIAAKMTAAVIGRDTALLFGDRVAAVSSHDTASVVGEQVAQLKSPKWVEVAGGQQAQMTSAGTIDIESQLLRLVGGYYPEAEAPSLDPGTTIGVMSRKDMRFISVEDCILVCAHKNLIATAHTGDVRVRAEKTASVTAGSIVGSAGSIKTKSKGDTQIVADGNISITANGDNVTITATNIILDGEVKITGNLHLQGNHDVLKDFKVHGKSDLG